MALKLRLGAGAVYLAGGTDLNARSPRPAPEHVITLQDLPLRDLRLPPNVRVLGITRAGQPVVPQGYTVLRRNDEVTLVGEQEHLEELANRWGY